MPQINWPAIGFTVLPNIGGLVGTIVVRNSINTWYETLKRPYWRTPNAAIAPVWATLYSSIGYASYLVFRDGGGFDGPARIPLIVYGSNLVFNWAWTPLFLRNKRPETGTIKINVWTVQCKP
ncbi:hypothetical protein NQ318_012453 [Aromia moschata]|uniref:Uncharacterized protein n=1 Tax=Aromia moschata TaxID=1265417 RepID=A0AAV8XI87_9CUCU|nr:hypothetical protein NQ318_012453 [Aromia moschata]